MSRCCASSAASITTRTRWRWCPRWWPRCRRSITTRWTSITRVIARSSRIASSPSCRPSRRRLQAFARPAVRLSAQRPRLLLEHAAHVLRGALREVHRRSGRRRSARPAVHPACRPRAERQHVDGAAGGFDRRQSLRGDFRRRVGAVGPGARRRQRSRARNARGNRHRRPDSEIPGDGQGQVQPLPPHGFRPSRLQELRSAREDHPRHVPQGAAEARQAGQPAARARANASKKPRSRTNTSSRASCTRTSISTRASSIRRSAFRARCSR